MPKITSEKALKRIAEENALYVRHLHHTANSRMSARLAGRPHGTFRARRLADPDFDAQCRAAVVFARAALAQGKWPAAAEASKDAGSLRAAGGEFAVSGSPEGRLQVRRARAGHVTAEGERAFLDALSATANVQLAAQSVGVHASAFYKRRAQSPDFAERMQEALEQGYETVEFSLVAAALRSLGPEDEFVGEGAGPLVPDARMTVEQAMRLFAQRARTMGIGARHAAGLTAPPPTREEVTKAILKRLVVAEKRYAKKRAAEEAKVKGAGPVKPQTAAEVEPTREGPGSGPGPSVRVWQG